MKVIIDWFRVEIDGVRYAPVDKNNESEMVIDKLKLSSLKELLSLNKRPDSKSVKRLNKIWNRIRNNYP